MGRLIGEQAVSKQMTLREMWSSSALKIFIN